MTCSCVSEPNLRRMSAVVRRQLPKVSNATLHDTFSQSATLVRNRLNSREVSRLGIPTWPCELLGILVIQALKRLRFVIMKVKNRPELGRCVTGRGGCIDVKGR
jgi:hypothetical protein